MNFIFKTPEEIAKQIAALAKEKRLSFNLSQSTLSKKAGVSLGVLKKFERMGTISLISLLKLAVALDSLNDFTELFKQPPPETLLTLDDILKEQTRKRGRK